MAEQIDAERRAMLTRIGDGELTFKFKSNVPLICTDGKEWASFQRNIELIMELADLGFVKLQPWPRNPHRTDRTSGGGYDCIHVHSLTPAGRQVLVDKPPAPANSPTATSVGRQLEIPPRAVEAFEQHENAARALGEDNPTDKAVYDSLKRTWELSGKANPLPSYGTWSRYLRIYREAVGGQRRVPRTSQPLDTGTVVPASEI